jgi:RNA polymerase sigma factor (sigma-70 family)
MNLEPSVGAPADSAASVDRWIVRAVAGDRSSQESLLLHFHDPLLASIRRWMAGGAPAPLAAEDVLQDALAEALGRIRTLQPQGERAFFAWMKAICRTRLLNRIEAERAQKRGGGRHRARRSAEDSTATTLLGRLAGPDPTPSLLARQSEAVALIAAAVARLDPARRRIVELRFGQGLSLQQIAEQTQKTRGAIKMIINRALKQLREELAGTLGETSRGA